MNIIPMKLLYNLASLQIQENVGTYGSASSARIPKYFYRFQTSPCIFFTVTKIYVNF